MSCVFQVGDNMLSADLLISLRERLLDIVSGSDRTRSLNPVAVPNEDPTDGDPATELVHLLREVLSSELTDQGEIVDYASLRASLLYVDFRRCTGKLRAFDPSTLPDRNARLAFWINLYNTLVLDAVITLGVRHSIMEHRAGLAFLRQAAYLVGGQRMSCDDIEHGILRANRGHPFFPGKQIASADPRREWVLQPFDARIHFALNCASRSCPPIRAYTPQNLDAQLDLATRSFLAADVQILPERSTIFLSSLFKWFADDFGGREGIIDFIASHLQDEVKTAWLSKQREQVTIRYRRYDWRLNEKAHSALL
jgi:hypothetical protein